MNAETGLPGNPKIAHRPARPKRNGLPGLTETRHKSVCAPTEFRAGFTRSRAPTETPPTITRTSCSRPFRNAASMEGASSAQCSTAPMDTPHLSKRARTRVELLS